MKTWGYTLKEHVGFIYLISTSVYANGFEVSLGLNETAKKAKVVRLQTDYKTNDSVRSPAPWALPTQPDDEFPVFSRPLLY
jgi:hypothetical protein